MAAETPITIEEIGRRTVVGRLGVPLGTAVEVAAEVVAGRTLRRKEDESVYVLRVTGVAGTALAAPVLLRFTVPGWAPARLAEDVSALHALRRGTPAPSLDERQIAALEEGYVGRLVHLTVYETGAFAGIPPDLPPEVPPVAATGFAFSTRLVVLAGGAIVGPRDAATP